MITLADLEIVAARIIGAKVVLAPEKSASDVPGWDSLNNTLIALEMSAEFGIEVSGEDLATCTTFGAVVELLNGKPS